MKRAGARPAAALAALTLLLSLLSRLPTAVPLDTSGYCHDGGVRNVRAAWMASLRSSAFLSDLSIPGTHDTMSRGRGGDIGETQSMSLGDQLDSGIRALDIRCRHADNACSIYHGIQSLGTDLDEVLGAVRTFLTAHPTEAILMRLKDKEHTDGDGVTESFEATYLRYVERYNDTIWQYTGNDNPRLGAIRGKLVILQNFEAEVWHSIPYSGQVWSMQDDYTLTTNWDLYAKWEAVQGHLTAAAAGPRGQLYMNYLSAAGGSFPYFVASGKSSPHGPCLLTGRVVGCTNQVWEDFPRISCVATICSICFKGTNELAAAWLKAAPPTLRVGVIMADFPGGGLIDAIIAHNEYVSKAYNGSFKPPMSPPAPPRPIDCTLQNMGIVYGVSFGLGLPLLVGLVLGVWWYCCRHRRDGKVSDVSSSASSTDHTRSLLPGGIHTAASSSPSASSSCATPPEASPVVVINTSSNTHPGQSPRHSPKAGPALDV